MANYHMEISVISRGKGHSVVRKISYICGQKLRDKYNDRTYYHNRRDVVQWEIFLPEQAPYEFHDLQKLCDEIDNAEVRYDARTAREFKGSLPNELPVPELCQIVREYVENNFIRKGLCAVVAIHEGRNEMSPEKNNPHVHIIVPTRSVERDGFSKKKDREWDKYKYIDIWREHWADVQNRAYQRNGLDIRVSHESLEVQGICDREPTIHLSRIDLQKERNGERTMRGDQKRAIQERNRQRALERQLNYERVYEVDRSR
jgi:ATP-dependent exoDNAse (exonuclease V) alpha subunit